MIHPESSIDTAHRWSSTRLPSDYRLLAAGGKVSYIGRQYFESLFSLYGDRNITSMQNTVAEHKALSMSGNAYFNSTTKFVKGVSPPADPLFPTALSALAAHNNHQPQSSLHLSSLILKSSPPRALADTQRTPRRQDETAEQVSSIEMAAISLSANVFMNATTKFVKGFADLSLTPQNKARTPQKKSVSQGKKKQQTPKKTTDPETTPPAVKKQKTPQKNALDMAASNYMTSTTKYMKPTAEGSKIDPVKSKVEKLVRSKPVGQSSNEKLEKILSREKGRERSNGRTNNEASPAKSKSSSGSKIERRKDRTRELKFVEKKQTEESQVTVKERTSSIDFKARRNDNKVQVQRPTAKHQIAQNISNTHQQNIVNEKLPVNETHTVKFQAKLPLNRLQRNKLDAAKSADTKMAEVKEESTRPFARHPQHVRPQLIQKHPNEMVKSATSLPSGELPLETPIKLKIQSSKVIPSKQDVHKPIARTLQAPLISVIKEQKSSALQNTKTTITNKRSTNQGSVREETSVHVNDNHTQQASTANKNSDLPKLAKNQSTKTIKKEEHVEAITTNYGVSKANLPRNIKSQEKIDDNAVVQPRPSIKRQQPTETVKESRVQTRKTATLSILEEKKPSPRSQKQIQSRALIKTQPSDKGSKTSIEQSTIDIGKRKNIISPPSQTNLALQNKSPPAKLQEAVKDTRPPQPLPEIKDLKPASLRQSIKPIEVKPQLARQVSKDQNIKKQISVKRSSALLQVLHKFYYNLVSKAFSLIVQQQKTSKNHSREALILAYGAVNAFKTIQRSFKASLFDQIKRIPQSKPSSRKQLNLNCSKEIAANIIFRVIVSKQRESFGVIKNNSVFQFTHNVQNKQKISQQRQQSHNRPYYLQQIRKIIESLLKKQVSKGFNKILLASASLHKKTIPIPKQTPPLQVRSPPKLTKPLRNYQAEKQALLQTKNEIQLSISSLESRMAEKKRYSDLEKSKLLKKQEDLTKKNKITENLVLSKRQVNKEKKNQLESQAQKQDLDISLPDYEPLIGLLTQIYSAIFASKEEIVNVDPIVQKYELNKEDHNGLLEEWSSLILNAKLKSEISKWQGENPFTSSDSKLKKDSEAISKMMRNFIRERYLWEWVKVTAQKV